MINPIPEKAINFAVYYEGEDLLGAAEGELPKLEAMTETVKGAGVAGEFDSVTLGHFGSMTLSLTWRNTTDSFVRLSPHKTHELYLYSAHQDYDAGLGEYIVNSIVLFVKVIPKTSTIGKLVVAGMTDTQTEFEVLYLKLEINGKERIEVDKLNYIYKVDGVDYLAAVRAALGKA
ncbi:MAG: phage major tail tube protein [Synergistaceae bacterium]|jgi:P2 family phage contractile tail tube protein|nr:phage major tail tube protein [Synergistaceae bacterium]